MGTRAMGDLAARIGGPVLRRYGFAQDQLITRWPEIAGPQFSAASLPVKLSFPPSRKRGGTLTVHIEGALATQLVHVQDVILERINSFFGYKAVERLRLVQAEVPWKACAARPVHSTAPAGPAPQAVTSLPDGPLREALIQLAATFSVDKQDV